MNRVPKRTKNRKAARRNETDFQDAGGNARIFFLLLLSGSRII